MGKRKRAKEKQKTNQVNRTTSSPDELLKNADTYLESGQYKKAIENYKAILNKTNAPADIMRKLLHSYQGRIKEFADKGMKREAIELWEFVTRTYNTALDIPFYIEQLFIVGDYSKGVNALYKYQDKITDVKYFQKKESFAALLLLAGTPGITQLIQPESLIIKQKGYVLDALRALYEGKDERASELMQSIGARSPYCDWKLLIKGMIAFYHYQDIEAGENFTHIPQDSPLSHISSLFQLLIHGKNGRGVDPVTISLNLEDSKFLEQIIGERTHVLTLLYLLQKVDIYSEWKKMVAVIENLAHILTSEKERAMLKDVSAYLLGLISDKKIVKEYERLWGEPLNPFVKCHLFALLHEKKHERRSANTSWKGCINAIKNNDARDIFPSLEERNLAIALIYRKMAKNAEAGEAKNDFLNFLDHLFDIEDEDEETEHVSCLIKSLEYDPQDIETYQAIINYYRKEHDDREVNDWLERFLEAFPERIETMVETALMAIKRRSLKKAIDFLDRALRLDPLNEKARKLKIEVHILLAYKKFKENKFPLVRKEFNQASLLPSPKMEKWALQTTWGVAEIAMGESKKSLSLINESILMLKGDIIPYFQLFIEGGVWDLAEQKTAPYNETLSMMLQKKTTIEKIHQLIQKALSYFQTSFDIKPHVRKRMRVIAPLLENALADSSLSLDDLLEICHYLAIVRHYPLLTKYAKKGISRNSVHPRFHFFYLIGESKGQIYPGNRAYNFFYIEKIIEYCEEAVDFVTQKEVKEFYNGMHPSYCRDREEAKNDDLRDTRKKKQSESKQVSKRSSGREMKSSYKQLSLLEKRDL